VYLTRGISTQGINNTTELVTTYRTGPGNPLHRSRSTVQIRTPWYGTDTDRRTFNLKYEVGVILRGRYRGGRDDFHALSSWQWCSEMHGLTLTLYIVSNYRILLMLRIVPC